MIEQNSKNEKSGKDFSQQNGSLKDPTSTNHSSLAQMKGFNAVPTSSAPPKSDSRGTGVRASTAEREPGSTNINFL